MVLLQCNFCVSQAEQMWERLKESLQGLDGSQMLDIKVTTHHAKRSLDANAYAWVLIGRISETTGIKKDEVYRDAIKQIGGNYETVSVSQRAADILCRIWEKNGLGWVTERFKSQIEGHVNLNLYYGSSVYDTKQMGRLIDSLVEDARALGIETRTDREISLLLEEPNGKK